MMNKAILIGRLGADPETRYTQAGSPVANMSLATNETYLDRDGQRQENTEWHRVVSFNKQAEFCSNYLTKGRLLLVEGRIQTRKWQDQQGENRYTTEIVAHRVQALDSKRDQQQQATSVPAGTAPEPPSFQQSAGPRKPDYTSVMDEAPF